MYRLILVAAAASSLALAAGTAHHANANANTNANASAGNKATPRRSPARPVELELSRAPQGHARLLSAQVGGTVGRMMFDSGGGITVISPALAQALGCATTGAVTGLRFTGQRLDAPVCRDVELKVGGLALRTDVAVLDLGPMLGKGATPVDGMISLATFAGLAVTLDLAGSRLWIESEGSLAARTRTMTELAFRPATGLDGGQLSPFFGVTTPRGTVWLEWDSGHGATTFVAPGAASLLGVPEGARSGEIELALAPSLQVHAPVVVRKDLVIDGVLSAAMVARATWTVDLAANRAWAGPIAPILQLPAAAPKTIAPASRDLAGVYELALVVHGNTVPHVLGLSRRAGAWIAELRAIGEDETLRLQDVRVTGTELKATLPLPTPAPLQLRFEGTSGKGSWGDPKARGGLITATKRT